MGNLNVHIENRSRSLATLPLSMPVGRAECFLLTMMHTEHCGQGGDRLLADVHTDTRGGGGGGGTFFFCLVWPQKCDRGCSYQLP